MIVKFDDVDGLCLANLLKFIHSEDNKIRVPGNGGSDILIVQIKSVEPKHQLRKMSSYSLTVDLLEMISDAQGPEMIRVDFEYLERVYEILKIRSRTQTDQDTDAAKRSDFLQKLGTIVGKESKGDIRIFDDLIIPKGRTITKTMVNQLINNLRYLRVEAQAAGEVDSFLLQIQRRAEELS